MAAQLATRLGATAVIDPTAVDPVEAIRELTKIGVDVTIEASGVPTVVPITIEAARKAGRVVLVGIPTGESTFNLLSVVATEKEIIGSLSHVYDEDFQTAIRLLFQAMQAILHQVIQGNTIRDQ